MSIERDNQGLGQGSRESLAIDLGVTNAREGTFNLNRDRLGAIAATVRMREGIRWRRRVLSVRGEYWIVIDSLEGDHLAGKRVRQNWLNNNTWIAALP